MNDRVFNALRKIATDVENVPVAKQLRDAVLSSYRPGLALAAPNFTAAGKQGSIGSRMRELAKLAYPVISPVTIPAAVANKLGKKIFNQYKNYYGPSVMEAVPAYQRKTW